MSNINTIINLEEVFDNSMTRIYSATVNFAIILTLCLAPFYYYLIIKKSTPAMNNYKKVLLIYTSYSMLVTLSMAFAKPGIALPLNTYIPNGWIPNLPEIPTIICYDILLISGGLLNDILLIALIQRYFNVSKIILRQNPIWKWMSYLFIAVIDFAAEFSLILGFNVSFLPKDKLFSYFHDKLQDPNGFLKSHPYVAVAANINQNYYLLYAYFINVTVIILRLIIFAIILYKNLTFAKRLSRNGSIATVSLHKMLVKTVITQISIAFIFTRFPQIVLYLSLETSNWISITAAGYYYLISLSFLPLIDMVITVYFVTPYRNFVISLFYSTKFRQSTIAPSIQLGGIKSVQSF